MAVDKQLSFAGGEVSPALYGKTDLQKFDSACRTLLNFIVHVEGGASNRVGLEFIGRVRTNFSLTRLIEFKFNTFQTYILELSDFKMRVLRDQAYVLDDAINITAISQSNPAQVTIGSHSLTLGQMVFISGVGGMVELVPRYYWINSISSTTIGLEDIFGKKIDSTNFTAYTSGGTVEAVPEFDAPWSQADLRLLKFTQDADVMTVVKNNYEVHNISRQDHNEWTIVQEEYGSQVTVPTGGAVLASPTTGTQVRGYRVTAIDDSTGEESLPNPNVNATNDLSVVANRNTFTWNLVSGASKYKVYCDDSSSGVHGFIGNASVGKFVDEFIDPDYTITPPENRSPVAKFENFTITGATQAKPCVLTITAGSRTPVFGDQVDPSSVVGMTELNGNTYFVTSATATTITLQNSDGTPLDSIGFGAYISGGSAKVFESNFAPRCVTYHQQRRIYAGKNNNPSGFDASKTGLFSNFNVSAILQADDAISYSLQAGDVNEIRDIQSQKELFLFTSSGVWIIKTGESLVFSADNISAEETEAWSVSNVRALKVGRSFLYVQDGGKVVRDLQDTLEANGFAGDELSILANHLFKDRTVVEWAYARDPDSVVWCVMDDGTALALTYLRKHQIWAWTLHETDGLFKSVASIPENTSEYGVYFVVERQIKGTTGQTSTMQYVERLKNKPLINIKDSFFVDSGLTLDIPIEITGATQTDPVVLTLDTTTISDDEEIDIDDVNGMVELNNSRFTVKNKTATTVELTDENGADIDGTGFTEYKSGGEARRVAGAVLGLDHLEGEEVSVLADGGVAANPLDPNVDITTVVNGGVTLVNPASRVHIGLPYTSDLQTIGTDLTSVNGLGDSIARKKRNTVVKARLENTAGLRMGPDPEHLKEFKPEAVTGGNAQAFINGVIEMTMPPKWDHDATVFVRQIDPLPVTINSITPEVEVVKNI